MVSKEFREYHISLSDLLDRAISRMQAKLTRPANEVKSDVLEFFRGRFVNLMADRYPTDAVDAVVSVGVRDYVTALTEIATLRGPVDTFFDKVMVMAEDEAVRTNRLALLTSIARLFAGVADFGRIG